MFIPSLYDVLGSHIYFRGFITLCQDDDFAEGHQNI